MWDKLWNRVPKKKPSEKRTEARLASCIDAQVWIAGRPITGHTKDISASGVRLHADTSHQFKAGEQYKLELQLPNSQRPIKVTGCVIRVDTQPLSPEKSSVAFHFLDVLPADQKQIREFVLRRRMERKRLDIADLPVVTVRTWVDGKPVPSFTKDISALGIKIQLVSTTGFRHLQTYPMEIELPGRKKPLHVGAKVVRIDERPAPTGTSGRWQVAFEFTEIEAEAKNAIRAFVFQSDSVAHAA